MTLCQKMMSMILANIVNIMMKIQHTNSKTTENLLKNLLNLPPISLSRLTMLVRIEASVSMEMKVVDLHLMEKKVVNFQVLAVTKEKSSMVDMLKDQTGHG